MADTSQGKEGGRKCQIKDGKWRMEDYLALIVFSVFPLYYHADSLSVTVFILLSDLSIFSSDLIFYCLDNTHFPHCLSRLAFLLHPIQFRLKFVLVCIRSMSFFFIYLCIDSVILFAVIYLNVIFYPFVYPFIF